MPASSMINKGAGTSNEGFQQGDVVIVGFALLHSHGGIAVAATQTGSPPLVRRSIPGRRRPRDTERLLTLDICLPTGTLRVEDDWMDIDLACAVRNECNATRSPVRLHRVTMPAERL